MSSRRKVFSHCATGVGMAQSAVRPGTLAARAASPGLGAGNRGGWGEREEGERGTRGEEGERGTREEQGRGAGRWLEPGEPRQFCDTGGAAHNGRPMREDERGCTVLYVQNDE